MSSLGLCLDKLDSAQRDQMEMILPILVETGWLKHMAFAAVTEVVNAAVQEDTDQTLMRKVRDGLAVRDFLETLHANAERMVESEGYLATSRSEE